ncbi:MAG: tRNA(m5U54)methyltransferase [Pleopsidium flavum]|nr:MAG: tRNA(m5U54)methyltransferase [Pleopsidium flavum]
MHFGKLRTGNYAHFMFTATTLRGLPIRASKSAIVWGSKVSSFERLAQLSYYSNGMTRTKSFHNSGRPRKKQKAKDKPVKEGSNEEVLLADIGHLLAAQPVAQLAANNDDHVENQATDASTLPERFTKIQVKISELSSTGDGLGLSSTSDHVYVVPFTAPGDIVTAKVITHFPKNSYTLADFVDVVDPSPQRDDSRIQCPYFATCSGCQLQMLSYEDQLAHKKTIVEKAYRYFSGLAPEYIPLIGDTVSSPLQYGYRTKLTPHFDGPPGSRSRKDRRNGAEKKGFENVPPIGFMVKGTRKTLDIEDCPIGTEAVRMGMKRERRRVAEELGKYKRGATLLLRESTRRVPKSVVDEKAQIPHGENSERDRSGNANGNAKNESDSVEATRDEATVISKDFEEKTCITDSNATSTEYVDDFVFSNTAGAFFQNNNTILPKFTAYIRDNVLPSSLTAGEKPIKYLIDAYSGSGLFTITLSSLFSSSTGIDIAGASIASARQNAKDNGIQNATFMVADASALFAEVTYPPDETVVVIDPPRKGCDDNFLRQLLRFGPRRAVYVSCNVHTQARDVGILVGGDKDSVYELESLRGFDFFPQTGHVEGVAILNRTHRGGDDKTA